MFSVFADWPPEPCKRLRTRRCSTMDTIICEPFYDQPGTWSLVEHSYVPYDDSGLQCWASPALYERLLKETGFELISVCIRLTRRPSTASSSPDV